MNIIELFLIAIALSMDAFAVSICKGMTYNKLNLKTPLTISIWFGFFQALMPLIGYLLGNTFSHFIASIDHWIAFILLSYIGYNMLKESKEVNCDIRVAQATSFKLMLSLSIATSIDALAAGVTFAFLIVNIYYAIIFIGTVTLIMSFIGVYIGNFFGSKLKSYSELFGGLLLIFMGIKILISHLFFG